MWRKVTVIMKIIMLHTLKNIKIIFLSVLLIKLCTDDRFSKPVILYRGKNAARKLIEAILEEYDYCKNIIKKHFNKTLAMPAEDEMKFQSSNKSWICNKLFVAGYNKVRDNDNVTGKYKGFLIGVVILILNWLKYFIIWKASFM